MHLPVDLQIDLLEMPSPRRHLAKPVNPLPADHCGEHRADPVPPERHGLMADVDRLRSASRSSTFRRDSGYFTYTITTSRISSGELLKQRNGFGGLALDLRLIWANYNLRAASSALVRQCPGVSSDSGCGE